MGRYQRVVEFLDITGTALSFPASAEADNVMGVQFVHSRRGGCHSAAVSLLRNHGDYTIVSGTGEIKNGLQVAIKHRTLSGTTTETWWHGFVDRIEWPGLLEPVRIEAVGYGPRVLTEVLPTEAYGPGLTTTEFTEGHPSASHLAWIVGHLYDTYLDTTTIGLSKGTIEGTDTSVSIIKMDGQRTMFDILRDLAVMAGDFTWGVDENRAFFFKSMPDTTTQYGVDTEDMPDFRQEKTIAGTVNYLDLEGGFLYGTEDENYHNRFEDTASQNSYRKRPRIVSIPEIVTDTDAQTYATAFFNIYASEQINTEARVISLTSNPEPWNTQFRFNSLDGTELATINADRVDVQMGEALEAQMWVGPDLHDPEANFRRVAEDENRRHRVAWRFGNTTTDTPQTGTAVSYKPYLVKITGGSGPYNCALVNAPVTTTWSSVPNIGDSVLATNDYVVLWETVVNGSVATTSIAEGGNKYV